MTSIPSDDLPLLSRMLQADGLPGVFVSSRRPWRELTQDTITHLKTTQTPIYVRHGQLVRVGRKEDDTPFIDILSETALKGILARSMNFVKVTEKGPQHIPPPDNVVKDVLCLGEWPFPPLDSIVEFPVFRPDGTLIETQGYDPMTHLVYMPAPGLRVPLVPEHPTADDIIPALALIHETIGQFTFENEASYANTVGLLLTPLIRQSIHGHVPLALIDATRAGTGKSLIAETVAMIATGRKASMMTAPYDDNEWRKRIGSTLSEGATIIVIDNVKAKLQAASLDSALTSFVFKDRILGQSKNGEYAQRATWMATGNNIKLGGDLPRRAYWIRMNANSDKPWMRAGFMHDLEEWVPAHRGELIAALLTLARAWFADGQPVADVPRMGSFQPWVNTIGGILAHAWMGACPFLQNLTDLYEQDDDAIQWAAFLHMLHDHYQGQEFLVSTLAKDIKEGFLAESETMIGVSGLYNALPDEISDVKHGDFRKRLGKALAARIGTQFDESGLHLVKARTSTRSGAIYWSVVAGGQVAGTVSGEQASFPPPSEQRGGRVSEDVSHNHSSGTVINEPALPQKENTSDTNAVGYLTNHLHLLDPVFTPRGEGWITKLGPSRVEVRMFMTQREEVFERTEDLSSIKRLLYGSRHEWPYTNAVYTDVDLIQLGYLSRTAVEYLPPDLPSLDMNDYDWGDAAPT